jgi:transposase
MYIPTLRKIIELYLRGFDYQEILRRTGIVKSTIQDTVNIWEERLADKFEFSKGNA